MSNSNAVVLVKNSIRDRTILRASNVSRYTGSKIHVHCIYYEISSRINAKWSLPNLDTFDIGFHKGLWVL